MPKGFTEQEKLNIREKLVAACTNNWTQRGYKKTSVDELCQKAGISKGAFYLFFDSKEDLFCEVLCKVQRRIYDTAKALMENESGKTGVLSALRFVYCEYDRNNFLYNSDSADYLLLMNKLKPEQAERAQKLERLNQELFLKVPNLRRKATDELTLSVLYSLLMGVKLKAVLQNHVEVFEFLAGLAIEEIYE